MRLALGFKPKEQETMTMIFNNHKRLILSALFALCAAETQAKDVYEKTPEGLCLLITYRDNQIISKTNIPCTRQVVRIIEGQQQQERDDSSAKEAMRCRIAAYTPVAGCY